MEDKVLALIIENYAVDLDTPLQLDTPLLDLNIIDSSAFFDLVELLRDTFGVTIPLTQLDPDNFASARKLGALVQQLSAAPVS